MTEATYIAISEKQAELRGKRRISVSGVLKSLGISKSGYYSWKKRLPSDQQKRKVRMQKKIKEIYEDSHQNYGAPKITKKLNQEGVKIAERTVGIYMKEMGIKAQYIKPYTMTTKDSDFSNKLVNILDEQFNPEQPNAAWCTDITYIWTFEGFVYLTSIMDLYSRKIIAWTLSENMEVACVIDTIKKAQIARNGINPRIIHSDRGVQYTCSAYQEATKEFINSYSKKAYPWDNACIESFHALLKREWINRFKIFDYNHAYKLVFEYIETFYNTVRIHSHCGYLSPNDYEREYMEKIEKKTRQTC